MELSEAQIAGLQNEGRAYCYRLGHERIGEGAEAFVAGYRRALEHLAAHEAKKQQDHLTQPCGVRTEPGEEVESNPMGGVILRGEAASKFREAMDATDAVRVDAPANAPERIYLQIDRESPEVDDSTWCRDKINDTDVLYIRADVAGPAAGVPVAPVVKESLTAGVRVDASEPRCKTAGECHHPDTCGWPDPDAEGGTCSICGKPTLYGSRHVKCVRDGVKGPEHG